MASRMIAGCKASALVAFACVLLAPQAAFGAGTVTLLGSTRADFVAGAGDINKLTVTAAPGEITFRDDEPGAVINTAVCAGNGTSEVTCTLPTLAFFLAVLGDQVDSAIANGAVGGTLQGGLGDDALTGSEVNSDSESLQGDEGVDTINTRNVVQLFGDADRGEGGPSTLAVGDSAQGGDGNDILTTGNGSDSASGGNGTDVISTGTGNDSGSGGDDDGDSVDLGPGNDTATNGGDDGTGDVLQGGPGVDLLRYLANVPPPIEPGTVFQSFTIDLLTGTANQGGTVPESDTTAGFEDVETTLGADTVSGTPGANSIATGSSSDQVNPGQGADLVDLEDGNDAADTRDGFFDRVLCASGVDTVQADQLDDALDCESVTVTNVRPAGADTTAPRCTLTKVRKRYKRKAFFRGLRPRASCDEAASLEFRLVARLKRVSGGRLVTAKAGDLVLAERSLRLSPAARRAKLKPPARLRRAIRGGFKARLVLEARDEFGNRRTLTKRLRVR